MTRTHTLTRLLPVAVTTVAALLLAGCGGGGSSGTEATTPTAQGTMSGNVVKGPVSGATVKAFAVIGGMMGPQVSSAITDSNGGFAMSMGGYAGPVLLQMTGGTYTDEATGALMTMGMGDMMTAVLPTVAGGSTVTGVEVTPLTAMAQAMAQRMGGGLTDANIVAANGAVGNYFMVGDILHTPPINPLVAGSGSGASQAMMNYGMTLAAMSQYAKAAGMPSPSGVVTLMMSDATDGMMDGRSDGTPVSMGGGMMGGGMMQADAGRTGLATAMAEFMNSGLNRSGVTAADMAPLIQRLGTSSGRVR